MKYKKKNNNNNNKQRLTDICYYLKQTLYKYF